ncbi:MAG: 50S ribosomal protein L30 [Armatimonadetes bacterium]|nr:50S ribosomal protein L30 [Armatimonadota bacterium]MDW8121177.1 50S ribosomal protein L30 [Armatimonadota bacterium]
MKAVRSYLTVRLVRSPIGCPTDQKATLRALGLKRLGRKVALPNNPSVQGMIRKVRHLVQVEEGPESSKGDRNETG